MPGAQVWCGHLCRKGDQIIAVRVSYLLSGPSENRLLSELYLGREITGWRHHRLSPRHRLRQVIGAAADLEDEFLREGLVIFLA
jgi:hypothetical protein